MERLETEQASHGCETLTQKWIGIILVTFHKRILEWQAAHPNITWVGWGIVWAIVLALLFWPQPLE